MNAGELFETAINHWRDAKGIGTAVIPSLLNDKIMVLGILQRVYSRSPTCKTVIITNNFQERGEIIEFITTRENEDENNEEFKTLIKNGKIKVFTSAYIEKTKPYEYPLLCIVYHPESIEPGMFMYLTNCKFKLVVLNKLLTNSEDMTKLYKTVPLLSDFEQNVIDALRLSTPVEEQWIGVDIPEDSEDKKLLDYYTEYISTSLSIFGSFDIMQQANRGNLALNISASQICGQIAKENGWHDKLDMNIEFNQEIDRLYNPMNLRDRAMQTYEIVRNRSQLLSDFKGKLDAILEIVQNNQGKKILIINKRGDFARAVTDYINNLSETTICMNYHDKVDNIPAVDSQGNPVFYKSGAKAGQRKTMGAKAQKSYAISKFNNSDINVLSTNNSPDKDLSIDVDVIIITSPMCEDIKSYMYRLSNICFRSQKLDLYSLYCRGTIEQRLLERKSLAENHNVKNVSDDENFSDFCIVD